MRRWPGGPSALHEVPWPVLRRGLPPVWPAVDDLWEGTLLLRLMVDEGVLHSRSLAGREGPAVGGARRRGPRPLVAGEIVENWAQLRESCAVRWGVDLAGAGGRELRDSFSAEVAAVLGAVLDARADGPGAGGAGPGGREDAREASRALRRWREGAGGGRGEAPAPYREAWGQLVGAGGAPASLPDIGAHRHVVSAINTGADVALGSALPDAVARAALVAAGVEGARAGRLLSAAAGPGPAGGAPPTVLTGRLAAHQAVARGPPGAAGAPQALASWGWATAGQRGRVLRDFGLSSGVLVNEPELTDLLGCSDSRLVMDGISWS